METRMYGVVKEHMHPETGQPYWHPAARQHISRNKNLRQISVCIMLEDGNIVERDIDLNQAFVSDIKQAIKNNKDPIDAMTLLLNIGSEYLEDGKHKDDRKHSIGE